MVFCIGLVPAYIIFVIVAEGGVDVAGISEFSSGKTPRNDGLNYLEVTISYCKRWPLGSEGKYIQADPLQFCVVLFKTS